MTTVFVDLVNLDGSRPEGSLRFSLERLVLGDPDVVPSAVEVKIRDGKARVENLLPGAMRVRVGAGCWSKDWQVSIPESGEHDLFELLEWQAPEFEETVWAALSKRVEALESAPRVDLAPVEQRLDALEAKPDPAPVDLAPLEDATRNLDNRVTALEGKPEPQPFDPAGLEAADKALGERVTALEQKPDPELFDPSALQAQLAELRAHFTSVELSYLDGTGDDVGPVFATGAMVSAVQHAGRVNITITTTASTEELIRALEMLKLPHFPAVSRFPNDTKADCSVELFQGAKFLTKINRAFICLEKVEGVPTFFVALDEVLAVVQETGANRMSLSTFYYTNDLPPTD